MSRERKLVVINTVLIAVFANIYYFLSLSGDHIKEDDANKSYLYYYGVAAQGSVSGPQSMKSDLAVVIGIIQLYVTIYVNVIEVLNPKVGYF